MTADSELRALLHDRAERTHVAPDAWGRFLARAEDPSGTEGASAVVVALDPGDRGRTRWVRAAVAAAAAVVLVAGVAVAQRDDATVSTGESDLAAPGGASGVMPAPEAAVPPDPGRMPPGVGGEPVFGVGRGLATPDDAAAAYLTDRLPLRGVVVEPSLVEGDLARVRWAWFEQPVEEGPIAGDPASSGTVFLWQHDGDEWVVQASLLDQVEVSELRTSWRSIEVHGTVTTGQATRLRLVPVVGTEPDPIPLAEGSFEHQREVAAVDHVVRIEMVGGATLGVAELSVRAVGAALGPVAPDIDAGTSAADFVADGWAQTVTGDPTAVAIPTDPDGAVHPADSWLEAWFEVPTERGPVQVLVGRVEGGLAVVAAWDGDWARPGETGAVSSLPASLVAPVDGTVEVRVERPDGTVLRVDQRPIAAGETVPDPSGEDPSGIDVGTVVRVTLDPADGADGAVGPITIAYAT